MAGGCGSPSSQSGDAPPSKAAPAEATPQSLPAEGGADGEKAEEPKGPGVRADGEIVSAVSWFHGPFEQALAKAKAENKLVFMDVGAYWCPPCHRLDEEVFVDPKVGEHFDQHFVAVHIDAEKGEGPELVERYRVQAFPTMLVLEPSGVEKARMVDFVPADELLKKLRQIAEGGNVLADLVTAVENDPDDLAKRYELAHAYLLAADGEAAKPEIEAVLVGDPKGELGFASRVLYDKALFLTNKLEGDPEAAIAEFRELQKRFPDRKEAVRAYRHIGRLLHQLERDDEAVASLQAMVATNPEDPALASSFGWFSFRQKCGPEAGLAAVRTGIAASPDDADLRYVEAELLHLLGDDAKALESMRKASELEPKTMYYRRQVRRFEALTEAAG